ncbi:glucosamine-6-phosphate deaminase [Fictibacillus enclensis]|uniref:glucosamine-6-phosphate deaminase n=1 Tax=Fictibacillus enclensis TaxID=1017270 RepID=UPI0025A15DEB|nr:glucosamine-6-phosphate deaminase [Fictibacillus enclensis]MDM5340521.1 glucosamine-6-phosphate deaminase [Fictibacillus enclensis]
MEYSPEIVKQFDHLNVKVFLTREAMGIEAASDVADKIIELLSKQSEVRMVFAAAPSQNELLAALVHHPAIDWSRVIAFHMDEYAGLAVDSPQSFGYFLTTNIFSKIPFKRTYVINGTNPSHEECRRYAELINEKPIDIVCLGIGENGHLAFNDPPVADFKDPETMKEVELDEACRQQQVNDGCFAAFDDVPKTALTLTIPALISGHFLFCVVPGPTKATAVHQTLNGEISERCPASILRTHPNCILYLDSDSYGGGE